MDNVQDPEFWMKLNPKIKAAIEALDSLLKESPDTYTTEELIQVWATLDYAHATMRTTVYLRPDSGPAMAAALTAMQSRGVLPNG